ncbi:MAG: serine/threonine protein kinase [Planctomycetales bacterium]|nr:serine/threonine protein kinase [Planctomycetales bacterium]
MRRVRFAADRSSTQQGSPAARIGVWCGTMAAIALLLLTGFWALGTVENSIRRKLAEDMRTILRADLAALRTWLESHKATARVAAARPDVAQIAREIVALDREGSTPLGDLRRLELQTELNVTFDTISRSHGYEGFALVDGGGRILAAFDPRFVGQRIHADRLETIGRAMEGETVVTRPFPWRVVSPSRSTETQETTMFVATPMHDDRQQPIAVLALRIPPEREFTEILQIARSGESGETYAFDRDGWLLSDSRFRDQLKSLGIMPADSDESPVLRVSIRDPGVDLTRGRKANLPRDEQPLTHMAANAINAGIRGDDSIHVNVDGYADYRGVKVVGAWAWLPKYDFGVATEADFAEAYAPLNTLRFVFGSLFGLVVMSSLSALVVLHVVAVMKQRVLRAERKTERLGQYTLEEKIGEGGMGEVYRASHAMLRRATAVKLIRPERSSERVVARFEREVQLTSQLTHANTVVIFDYGRTPEDVFYYAMEYVDGMTLAQLIELSGAQPESRVIHILKQICGSLAEAHHIGLIHRDIKPANVMLCQRGGQADVVKVLDFGLVKDLGGQEEMELSLPGAITGTPLYMPPELARGGGLADARSDLYAVGAVGYYLLTGEHVFAKPSSMAVLQAHLHEAPLPPSERYGRPVSSEFENLLLRCLAKDPSARPHSANEMIDLLDACPSSRLWTRHDAEAWWSEFGPQLASARSESNHRGASTDDRGDTVLVNR